MIRIASLGLCFLLLLSLKWPAQSQGLPEPTFAGTWKLDFLASSDIDPWRSATLDLALTDSSIVFTRFWRAGKYFQRDSVSMPLDGSLVEAPVRAGKWFEQVYEGVFVPRNAVRHVQAAVKEEGRLLHLASDIPLETSQGLTRVRTDRYLRVSSDGARLVVAETRSSRDAPPMVFLYDRVIKP